MKKLLAILLTVLSFQASPATIAMASNGHDTVLLTDEPCTLEIAKKLMPPELFSLAHRADALINGQKYSACYVVDGDTVGILYEDGDAGMIPKQAFRKLLDT